MKVALIHYWLVGMRGGEKVLEALSELYPDADIFTHVVDPDRISTRLLKHTIKTSFIARLPQAKKRYKSYLPLMPLALEQLDLRAYDLVISSEAGPAKGIIPPPHSTHICYCHSPMRYVWNMYHDYRETAGLPARLAMPVLGHYLRMWDESSAARVDEFVANSYNVAQRINKYYRRNARVIHPPVDVDAFELVNQDDIAPYYLMVGELVRYKRPDLAVEAFNRLGRELVVVGGGEMLADIKRMARSNITVLGPQPFDVLRHHYARARALIFPGEEDFGIVPVESMASGRPVIAFGRGGALESVIDGVSGVHFPEQTVDSLIEAVDQFESIRFDPLAISTHAATFSEQKFKRRMMRVVDAALVNKQSASSSTQLRRSSAMHYGQDEIVKNAS